MNIVSKEPILEGWSNDKKYRISNEKGERFLLRVSDIAKYDTKQSEFEMMQSVASLGVPMCLPIEFGTCDEGVYCIQSWIDGESAEDLIPLLPSGSRTDINTERGLWGGATIDLYRNTTAPSTECDARRCRCGI